MGHLCDLTVAVCVWTRSLARGQAYLALPLQLQQKRAAGHVLWPPLLVAPVPPFAQLSRKSAAVPGRITRQQLTDQSQKVSEKPPCQATPGVFHTRMGESHLCTTPQLQYSEPFAPQRKRLPHWEYRLTSSIGMLPWRSQLEVRHDNQRGGLRNPSGAVSCSSG